MKKVLIGLVFLIGFAVANSQIIAPKGIYIGRGVTAVSGTNIAKIDSATITNTVDLRFFNGADTLNPYIPVASQIDIGDVAPLLVDTVPLITFGLGTAQTVDTAVFVDNALAGAFFNKGSDTLKITSLKGVLASGTGTETIAVQVSWSDTLQAVVPTNLNAAAYTITSMTVGDEDTSFANESIPPNVWVWCKISGVSAGNRPGFLNVTLSGYRKHTY